jgi:hypothetical protein
MTGGANIFASFARKDVQVAVYGGDVTGALPNHLTDSNDPSYEATCQSGYGAVCKTVYPGSIPGVASIEDGPLVP